MADAAFKLSESPGEAQPDRPPEGRRERTKAANRQQILDSARAVFGELGYETATVRDIIRQTGLSVGAFYNYFRSKEEVYEALADDGARRFRPLLREAFTEGADFETYLRRAITAYYTFIVYEQDAWSLKRPPGEAAGPHLRAETPEMLAVFTEVERAFENVIARGLAPRVDAGYLAAAAIGVTREIGHRMLERRSTDTEGAAEFAVRMILGGLPALPRLQAEG